MKKYVFLGMSFIIAGCVRDPGSLATSPKKVEERVQKSDQFERSSAQVDAAISMPDCLGEYQGVHSYKAIPSLSEKYRLEVVFKKFVIEHGYSIKNEISASLDNIWWRYDVQFGDSPSVTTHKWINGKPASNYTSSYLCAEAPGLCRDFISGIKSSDIDVLAGAIGHEAILQEGLISFGDEGFLQCASKSLSGVLNLLVERVEPSQKLLITKPE